MRGGLTSANAAFALAWRLSEHFAHLRRPPGVNLGHAAREFGSEIAPGQVDVLEGGAGLR